MASVQSPQLKDEVQDFWNAEPYGSRYLEGAEDFEAFEAHARSRYAPDTQIPQFAKFPSARAYECWRSALVWALIIGADTPWLQKLPVKESRGVY